jgi:hypothetical protein
MNDIDALTLKLLTSKKKYNTYLGTVEPDTASKIRKYCDAIHANKDRIRALFDKYMEDPEIQITNELDDSVESCLKELLKHLETRDREKKSARNDYDEEDESDKEEFNDFNIDAFKKTSQYDEDDEETSEGSGSCFATKGSDSCFATKEEKPKKEKQSFFEKNEAKEKTSFFEKNEAKEKTSFWGKGVNRASGTLDNFIKHN